MTTSTSLGARARRALAAALVACTLALFGAAAGMLAPATAAAQEAAPAPLQGIPQYTVHTIGEIAFVTPALDAWSFETAQQDGLTTWSSANGELIIAYQQQALGLSGGEALQSYMDSFTSRYQMQEVEILSEASRSNDMVGIHTLSFTGKVQDFYATCIVTYVLGDNYAARFESVFKVDEVMYQRIFDEHVALHLSIVHDPATAAAEVAFMEEANVIGSPTPVVRSGYFVNGDFYTRTIGENWLTVQIPVGWKIDLIEYAGDDPNAARGGAIINEHTEFAFRTQIAALDDQQIADHVAALDEEVETATYGLIDKMLYRVDDIVVNAYFYFSTEAHDQLGAMAYIYGPTYVSSVQIFCPADQDSMFNAIYVMTSIVPAAAAAEEPAASADASATEPAVDPAPAEQPASEPAQVALGTLTTENTPEGYTVLVPFLAQEPAADEMIPLQTKTLGTWEIMVPLHPYFKEVGTYWESWNSNFPEPVYVVGVPVLITNVGDVEDDPEFAIDVITFGTDGLEQRGNLTMDIWDNSIYDHGAVPAGETIEVFYYFVYTGPGEYALFFDKWDTNETFEVPMELAL